MVVVVYVETERCDTDSIRVSSIDILYNNYS